MAELQFRLAVAADEAVLRKMIIDSFEPITWFKKLDERVGPLNGLDWRQRWEKRLDKVFAAEIVLVGEYDGQIAAVATGTIDADARLGYVDLLGVDQRFQGQGLGREMLRGMLEHFRGLGMEQAHLECLTDNDRGNALYASEGWQTVASSHHWFRKI